MSSANKSVAANLEDKLESMGEPGLNALVKSIDEIRDALPKASPESKTSSSASKPKPPSKDWSSESSKDTRPTKPVNIDNRPPSPTETPPQPQPPWGNPSATSSQHKTQQPPSLPPACLRA